MKTRKSAQYVAKKVTIKRYAKILSQVEPVDQAPSAQTDVKSGHQGKEVRNSCTSRVPDVRYFSQHGEVNGDCDLRYLWRIYQTFPINVRIAFRAAVTAGLNRKYPTGIHIGFFHYLQNFTIYPALDEQASKWVSVGGQFLRK